MAYFPLFRDLENQKIVIVGGGRVALRKAEKLLPFGPKITVIAPQIHPALEQMNVDILRRAFQPEDITEDLICVIAACNDSAVNQQVYRQCIARSIPVNVVDNPACCTFLFPSLVKRGKLTVGITTSGASPSAAIWMKEQIAQLLPENMEDMLSWLDNQRTYLKNTVPVEGQRSACLKQLFLLCMERNEIPDNSLRDEIIRTVLAEYESEK